MPRASFGRENARSVPLLFSSMGQRLRFSEAEYLLLAAVGSYAATPEARANQSADVHAAISSI